MKSIKISFVCSLVFIALGCCDNEEFSTTIENCESIKDAEILSEEEKHSICIYNNVYRYQSEIYTVGECCICDEILMAVDCNGNFLCELDEFCMNDFFENAEYLFAVTSE